MSDKKQLAAMGAQYRLTEEQAKGLAERMPQTGALQVIDDEQLCMAKRIEELEARVRVMAELLQKARPYMDHRGGAGVKGYTQLAKEIDSALAGNLPIQGTPEGWQLVPVEPTDDMFVVGGERLFDCVGPWEGDDDTTVKEQDLAATIYRAMLAAAPSLDSAK